MKKIILKTAMAAFLVAPFTFGTTFAATTMSQTPCCAHKDCCKDCGKKHHHCKKDCHCPCCNEEAAQDAQ
ncbi:hypothetical protein FAI40_07135 [Acetobacteraceae bacterium]|nr:hypothetical protein FAI40_07135 [Acetobacteraceae bacterium]